MGSLTYQAIRDLQPIARNIGDTIANNAINSAKNRRADAALRYTIGRQRAEDEQRNELFRRNTEKYQRENAWRGQHFNIANLPNSPHALGHLAAKTTTGEMLADGIARQIGGKLVKDPNSQDNGKIIMPDGSIATNQDVANNWTKVRAYMFQHTNAEKLAHDEMAKAAYAMQHARTPEEKAQFKRSYNAYQNFLNDPRKRIMQIDHKINILTQLAGQMRGEGIENDIKRLQEKKKAIRGDWNKAQDRALQRELADKRIRAERAKAAKKGTPNRKIELIKFYNEVYKPPGGMKESLDLFRSDQLAKEGLKAVGEEIAARKYEFEGLEPKELNFELKKIFDKYVGDLKSQREFSKKGGSGDAKSYTQSVIDQIYRNKIKVGTNQ